MFMNLNTGLLYDRPIEGFAIFAIMFAVLFTAYLLGSINSAILISKLVYHDDIRKHGSGNGGATNMLRTFGGKAAALTIIGDLMKTAIAILRLLVPPPSLIVGSIRLKTVCRCVGVPSTYTTTA